MLEKVLDNGDSDLRISNTNIKSWNAYIMFISC